MLYLVDTLNLWNVVGGVAEKAAAQLFALAQDAPATIYQKAPGLAGAATLKASQATAQLPDASCQNALTFAGLYVACTETFSVASQHAEAPRGHWVVLLYHLRSGTQTLRPFYMASPTRRKLSPQEHMSSVLGVMRIDVLGKTSTVSQRILAAGGLNMAETLARRVTERKA